MTTLAPVATLEAPCTLLAIEGLTICTQRLLLDGKTTPANILLHQHIVPAGGFCFIAVPIEHLPALDLDDTTITRVSNVYEGTTCGLVFKHYQHALDYLTKHYGLAQATDRAPLSTDVSPRLLGIVLPAPLSTPPRLTRRPLSTTAFSPYGVIHMSKKQPIRVFLDQEIHSRYLIQAGTHGLTPSALGERLIQHGITQLEGGDKAPLEAPGGDVPPAPTTTQA
ncbi:hypothetical protein [Vreelandella zhanjiangensis]|uniref:hypothetical protein n=1 Tax=Vreelandella zhanjiangensis TaxID=1121960 RepID=UPI0003731C2F|nr:hypothetical protein [Halomonas zhanjiangensis]